MEAATAAPPAETESNTVKFRSGDINLRIVLQSKKVKVIDGQAVVTDPGHAIQFVSGVYEVDLASPDAEVELERLRSHDHNGSNPKHLGQQLFVEEGKEPGRPPVTPDSTPVLKRIVRLTAQGNSTAIAEEYTAEQAAFSRPEILAACVEALEALETPVPDPPLTPEHEVERVRAEPAVGDTPGVVPLQQPARTDGDAGGSAVNPAPAQPTPPPFSPPAGSTEGIQNTAPPAAPTFDPATAPPPFPPAPDQGPQQS